MDVEFCFIYWRELAWTKYAWPDYGNSKESQMNENVEKEANITETWKWAVANAKKKLNKRTSAV